MVDSAEDIFGPDVLNANIDELAASRTQAATTASQTIILARQLIDEHNNDLNSHPETTPKYANSEEPGIVIIDETLSSTLDYAVPNTTAIKNYVGEIVSSALTYAGQLDISEFNSDTQTITINKAVKKGNVFIITGSGSFEYNGHVYSSEDYIIAKSAISASAAKQFSSFDWFNIQDTDVVKVDKSQYLTNKNLSDTTNVYRNATTQLNGAVVLASSLDDDRPTAVTTSSLVKDKLAEKLTVINSVISGDNTTKKFTPLDDTSLNISHLDTQGKLFNLDAIHKTDTSNKIVQSIYLPECDNQTEFLALRSDIDDVNLQTVLDNQGSKPATLNTILTIAKTPVDDVFSLLMMGDFSARIGTVNTSDGLITGFINETMPNYDGTFTVTNKISGAPLLLTYDGTEENHATSVGQVNSMISSAISEMEDKSVKKYIISNPEISVVDGIATWANVVKFKNDDSVTGIDFGNAPCIHVYKKTDGKTVYPDVELKSISENNENYTSVDIIFKDASALVNANTYIAIIITTAKNV